MLNQNVVATTRKLTLLLSFLAILSPTFSDVIPIALEVSEASTASESENTESAADLSEVINTNADDEIVSESISVTQITEKEKIDYFETDPFVSISLKDLEKSLQQIRLLTENPKKIQLKSLAGTEHRIKDRHFRRQSEFICRVAHNNLYPMQSSFPIFVKLVEIANKICKDSASEILNQFGGNLIRNPLAKKVRLAELEKVFEKYLSLSIVFEALVNNSEQFLKNILDENTKRHGKGKLFIFSKKANKAKISKLKEMIPLKLKNQLKHHIQFCMANLDYLETSSKLDSILSISPVSKIVGNCADFENVIESYQTDYKWTSEQYKRLLSNQLDMCGSITADIYYLDIPEKLSAYSFPARDCDNQSEPVFEAKKLLRESFCILEKMADDANKIIALIQRTENDVKKKLIKEKTDYLFDYFNRHLTLENWPNKVVLIDKEKIMDGTDSSKQADKNLEKVETKTSQEEPED